MQKPFAGLLSDVLWYVHALDPIGVQKSDTTSLLGEKKQPQRLLFSFVVRGTGFEPVTPAV